MNDTCRVTKETNAHYDKMVDIEEPTLDECIEAIASSEDLDCVRDAISEFDHDFISEKEFLGTIKALALNGDYPVLGVIFGKGIRKYLIERGANIVEEAT